MPVEEGPKCSLQPPLRMRTASCEHVRLKSRDSWACMVEQIAGPCTASNSVVILLPAKNNPV